MAIIFVVESAATCRIKKFIPDTLSTFEELKRSYGYGGTPVDESHLKEKAEAYAAKMSVMFTDCWSVYMIDTQDQVTAKTLVSSYMHGSLSVPDMINLSLTRNHNSQR